MEPQAPPAGDLRDHLETLRRGKGVVAAVTFLVVGSALFFSSRQDPLYVSEARVLVRPIGVRSLWPQLVNLDTERGLVRSTAVAALVQEDLGLPTPPGDLLAGVDASVEADSEILQVRYSDPDPRRARDLAQGFAEAYLRFRREQAEDQLEAETSAIHRRISATESDIAEVERRIREAGTSARRDALSAQRDTLVARLGVLQQSLEDLRVPGSFGRAGGEVVQPAGLPAAPSTPTPVRDALVALAVGLGLGVGVAFLREHARDRLQGPRELEERAGAPVLATVPRVRGWWLRGRPRLVSMEDPASVPAEAYRTLRTTLRLGRGSGGPCVVAVTAPAGGEGKTTTAANLAVSLAQTGLKVVAVSCDLRRPRLHRFFGAANSVGVSSILQGRVPLSRALVHLPSTWSLWLLPSGPVPPNPAELLASEAMAALLEELRGFADVVVVDTPPVLPVADVLILAPRTDGLLLVADAARTPGGAVAQARAHLDRAGARIVGAVLNNVDPSALNHYVRRYPYHALAHPGEVGGGDPSPAGPARARSAAVRR